MSNPPQLTALFADWFLLPAYADEGGILTWVEPGATEFFSSAWSLHKYPGPDMWRLTAWRGATRGEIKRWLGTYEELCAIYTTILLVGLENVEPHKREG